MISVFITDGVYDRLIIPLASKLRGKPVRISAKNRMGIGLFFCFLDLVVSAVVKNIRRKAIREGYIDNPEAVLDMSAMWLIPHNVLNGIAEAFNAISQSEFYYTEFSRSMSSIAAALFSLGSAIGNLLASLISSIVETSLPERENRVGSLIILIRVIMTSIIGFLILWVLLIWFTI
ncbi:hypothetical protein S83_053933 [Arachis hypogaea]